MFALILLVSFYNTYYCICLTMIKDIQLVNEKQNFFSLRACSFLCIPHGQWNYCYQTWWRDTNKIMEPHDGIYLVYTHRAFFHSHWYITQFHGSIHLVSPLNLGRDIWHHEKPVNRHLSINTKYQRLIHGFIILINI